MHRWQGRLCNKETSDSGNEWRVPQSRQGIPSGINASRYDWQRAPNVITCARQRAVERIDARCDEPGRKHTSSSSDDKPGASKDDDQQRNH